MTLRTRLRALAVAIVTASLAASLVVAPLTAPVAAAATSGASFDAGFIISDETFYNRAAMNTGQVQAFLNDKGRNCVANSLPCLKDIAVTWPALAGDAYCGARAAGSGKAADLFIAVASSCGINPQVLLVLVEKEQSLVSRSSPSDRAYRFATGFNCPDTAPCSDASSGFATQVHLAAKQYQRYRVNPGSYNYRAGRVNNILFNPNTACGSSPVFIRNQATAGLYNYTPYQPNASALANMYGTGDGCGAYGNRNFFRMFSDWFGNPGNMLTAASFEGTVAKWGFANGAMARQVAGPSAGAQSGKYFLSMYSGTPGRSLSQDVSIATSPRQAYTGSIWVKSGTVGKTFSGVLALWGLGGSIELAQTPFTVGETWTEIKATLPIQRAGHTVLRLEIYLLSTDALLSMDNTSLFKDVVVAPRAPLALSSPSFEAGVGTWFANGAMSRQVVNVGTAAQDGSFVLTTNTPVAGRSIGQDVKVSAVAGDSYTATIWVRSSSDTQNAAGTFAVWGLGGTAQAASHPFSVGSTWTPVTQTLTLSGSATTIRLEIYLGPANLELWFDNASIVPNLAPNPSFEATANSWNTGITPSALDRIAGTVDIPAMDGRWIAVTKPTFTGGSVATDVVRSGMAVGETYTTSIWMRAATPGNTWEGTLAIWALGGVNEAASVPVSVSDTWTLVTLPITLAQPGHGTLHFELYNNSPGELLYLDGARIN